MKIVLTGPFSTKLFCDLTNIQLVGAPPGQGGAPVTDLAASLQRLGIDVTVVTLDPTIEEAFRVKSDGFTVVYCPLRAPPRYRARIRAMDLFEVEIRHLTREIKDAKPDLVHAHWTYEYAEAAVRSCRKHLVTMHDLGWGCLWQYRDGYRAMRLIMKYRVMPRVRNLSVVSPFMAIRARQYGYFREVAVVPNGISIPKTSTDRFNRLAPIRIVTVGDNGRLKNVRASLDAFSLLSEALPDAELHLFGPGLDETFCRGQASVTGHGTVQHAHLMSFLEQHATVLVHPSRLEAFGMILAEAKARGVPIVAGRRSGGAPYVCDDGVSSLVDIESPRAIADAVLSLLSDKDRYLQTSQASRDDAELRFSSSKVTEQYLSLYRRIISE